MRGRAWLMLSVMAAGGLAGPSFACGPSKALQGTLQIPQCDPAAGTSKCVPAPEAVYNALQALDMPGVFTIGIQTSPWRMYDGHYRIVTVREMAETVRKQRPVHDQRVLLVGSWTGAMPDGSTGTLSARLSSELGGLPVDGSDGFLWLSPDGAMHATRQAFSMWRAGLYYVEQGKDVMVAMVPGAMVQFEDRFAEEGNAEGVLRAGVGNDVFMLCPHGALAAFERAAEMGSAIAAYNAAMMHEEAGETDAARVWFRKAAALGDTKAAKRLEMHQ